MSILLETCQRERRPSGTPQPVQRSIARAARAVLVAGLLLGLAACSTPRPLTPTGYAEVTALAQDRTVQLALADGQRLTGRRLRLHADSTTLLRTDTAPVPFQVPTAHVTHLRIEGAAAKRAAAGRYGLLAGLLLGAGVRTALPDDALLAHWGTYLMGPALGGLGYLGGMVAYPDRRYLLAGPVADPLHAQAPRQADLRDARP